MRANEELMLMGGAILAFSVLLMVIEKSWLSSPRLARGCPPTPESWARVKRASGILAIAYTIAALLAWAILGTSAVLNWGAVGAEAVCVVGVGIEIAGDTSELLRLRLKGPR